MSPPVLAVENLTHDFPSVRALEDVTLGFRAGEVHGLVGENGAGKSTLMNALAGLINPTAGRILIDGRPMQLAGPADAQARGIAMIHQELNLVDDLTVADNIFLGRESTRAGLLRKRYTRQAARDLLDALGCEVSPGQRVGSLSVAQQQMVEIAKALSVSARVLIMDEPTAALTRREVQRLFELIDRLRRRGVAIIYISHVLPEVLHICDRISVLRDGRLVRALEHDDIYAPASNPDAPRRRRLTERALANMMVGRDIDQQFPDRPAHSDDVVLRVDGLTVPGHSEGVSFELHRGEILGFAGLIGAGRTETAEAIAGLRRGSGRIELDGKPIAPRNPRQAADLGIAYVSEDRRRKGLVMGLDVGVNTTLVSLKRYARPLISKRRERAAVARQVKRLGIRVARLDQLIDTLSGGNQQRVAIARWLEIDPRVLIIDEPTRGVDVGARAELYRLIAGLARDGLACILIASEMTELLGMCHRIAVFRRGRIEDVLDGPTATEQQIMHLAAGVRDAAAC